MMEQLQNEQLNSTNPNDQQWEIEGMKDYDNEKRAAFDNHSPKYLPTNLPLFESEIEVGSPTKLILPLTVSIRVKKAGAGFKATRLMVAMMKALQMSSQDTYIGTLDYDKDPRRIVHHNQVPLQYKELLQFMEEPHIINDYIYTTKIKVHTNKELKEYLTDKTFWNYLTAENIHIEYNNLDCIVPHNVGFLEEVTSSRDTIQLHEARLRRLLPTTAPKFQVNLYRAYGTDNRTTFLVMVQSKAEDVETLTLQIQAINEIHMIVFFPWEEFIKITNDKKQTIITDYRQWNYMYKSIVVPGFVDNDDNIPMWVDINTSVSDYLLDKLHPITGRKMFEFVYPSILGKREFIVFIDNFGDSETYLKYVIGEFAKLMPHSSLELEFSCSDTVKFQMTKQDWKPFGRAHSIVGIMTDTKKKRWYAKQTHENL
jgi:hypothetical protein